VNVLEEMSMQSDTDATSGNVTPIRPLDDEAALAWIRAQPGGRTSLSAAELGRRWGWQRYHVSRRLQRWKKDGLVAQRGSTLTAVDIQSSKAATNGLQQAATNSLQHIEDAQEPASQPSRSVAVRNAARDAATVTAPQSRHVAQLARLDGAYVHLPPADAQAPGRRHGGGIRFAALTAALALATVSGGFSITGMTSIFVGAFWPVIGMGVALEVGKLCAVAALPTLHRGTLKAALVVLVAVLMTLNAVGCFGYLSKAHIGHLVDGDVAVAGRSADIEGRISVQADLVADLDRRIGQIDGAVEKSTAKGRTNAAMQLAADQRRNRAELAAQRDRANKALADLKIEKAKIEGDRKVAEADLGPVRYLATLLGAGDQDVLRWFILVVALLLDPAAVLLLLAATRRG
jgi:hypothetical protein